MTSASGLTVTHTSTVTPDQIDHLGHMNVRYYGVNACSATRSLVGAAPIVDMYTRHHREQLVGAELEVRSGLLDVDDRTVRLYHELANTDTGDVAATFVYRARPESAPSGTAPDETRSIEGVETVEIPVHGQPRSIDLASVMARPSLADVRRLDLALRAPRTIDESDEAAIGSSSRTVGPDMAAMLFWGGDPVDGSGGELLHTGPNGEQIGWATMETRVVIDRFPTVGTRIQSFCATTAIGDKTTQQAMWVYDLDSASGAGALLGSFDVVSVVFDVGARRAMSIPPEMRSHHESLLHPELAARPR